MDENTDNRELEHRFELLKKDYEIMEANIDGTLNTMRTDIDGTLKTMRADIDGTLKDTRTDIERNNATIERINTEAARRETRMIITIAGLIVGGIAILGFILN